MSNEQSEREALEEVDLIVSVLRGYPMSMARDDAIRAAHKVRAALASRQEGDSYEAIWNALQQIDSVAAMLPTYTVDHDGGIEAFTQNIVDAIAAVQQALASRQAVSEGWRNQAAGWLRAKADEQERVNSECPAHAAAYPSWTDRVRQLRWLAEDVLAASLAQPQAAQSAEPLQPGAIERAFHASLARNYYDFHDGVRFAERAHCIGTAQPAQGDGK